MSHYIARIQLTDTVVTRKGPKEKKVTESYVVEALSLTEAEAKVVKDFQGYTLDFEVKSVSASKIIKIIE